MVNITTVVNTRPYLRPLYEYAIASMMGAYIPYVLDPNIYLATLTIVANTVIATSNSKTCLDTPFSNIHSVKGE